MMQRAGSLPYSDGNISKNMFFDNKAFATAESGLFIPASGGQFDRSAVK
jgi:hypothetical protein